MLGYCGLSENMPGHMISRWHLAGGLEGEFRGLEVDSELDT